MNKGKKEAVRILRDHSLYESFKKNRIGYYGIHADIDSLFALENKQASRNCREFIKRYFVSGEKLEVFDLPFLDEYYKSGKHLHTVSLYLLGCILNSLFSEKIEDGVKTALNRPCDWYHDYLYSWFLTCLYHDIASCIEKNEFEIILEQQKHLEYYLGKLNIKYTPYNHQPMNRGAELNYYPEELIKNYFYYRVIVFGAVDHGIIGGYLLFDRLINSFITKTKGHNWREGDYHWENPQGRLLCWREDHPDHFAYVADAVICHNVWAACYSKDIAIYKKFGLDPLIMRYNDEKVSLEKFPLHFMLQLLDTIEPTKRFLSLSAREVLQKVYIYHKGDKIIVGWDANLECEHEQEFERWHNSITDLGSWMCVTVSGDKEADIGKYVTIKLQGA